MNPERKEIPAPPELTAWARRQSRRKSRSSVRITVWFDLRPSDDGVLL